MNHGPSRRTFVRTLMCSAVVTGFDPVARAWATAGSPTTADALKVPRLTGRLLDDPADLTLYADDFGHLIHRTPRAVLEPASVRDIAVMIKFCALHQLPVAPRGQGHQTYGQAQVCGGLVIDMSPLNAISVDPIAGTASVGAGAVWSAVLTASLAHGLTPPVFTDYIELSVGGTLAAGGFGGATQRFGAQVDTISEIDVVTGTGQVITCSATRRADLFRASLAGLGQVGVITRATVRLVPAPASVRKYTLAYPSATALMTAQRRVVRDGRFDWLEGAANPVGGGWQYALEGAAYFNSSPPDDAALIGDLGYEGTAQIQDLSYVDFVDALAPAVAFLKSTGEWFDPHPWLNLLLPDAAADAVVTTTLAGTTGADIGASGLVLLYPVPTAKLKAPLLRVPAGELAFLFSMLRTAAPDAGALPAATMLAENRELYLKNRALGGTQYPVGSIPGLTAADWRLQYGDQWPFFLAAKRRYDPHRILTPGQGIFADPGRPAGVGSGMVPNEQSPAG